MVNRVRCCARVYLLAFGMGLTGAAFAAESWRVDYDKSRIGFIARYDSIEFPGIFERWRGEFLFAPYALNKSKFDIIVDMASVNTRSRDRDIGIRSEEWFDVAQFGKASYLTKRFERRPDGTFEVVAEFRIKGVTQPLRSTFSWADVGDTRRLRGRVKVDRRTLKIGTGEWAEDAIIGFGVTITYDIVMRK